MSRRSRKCYRHGHHFFFCSIISRMPLFKLFILKKLLFTYALLNSVFRSWGVLFFTRTYLAWVEVTIGLYRLIQRFVCAITDDHWEWGGGGRGSIFSHWKAVSCVTLNGLNSERLETLWSCFNPPREWTQYLRDNNAAAAMLVDFKGKRKEGKEFADKCTKWPNEQKIIYWN